MWGLLIAFLVGIAYGWMSPGKQDKSRLFMRGLLWSIGIALVLALIGFFFGVNPLGVLDAGFIGLAISFVVLVVVFLVGVWIGDMLDRSRHAGARRV